MNAQELFLKDGKSAGVFYCEKCKVVHRTKDEAECCCVPTTCKVCGKEVERKHYSLCDSCQEKDAAKKEADRFAKADKITGSDNQCFYGDTFYNSVSDLTDDLPLDEMPEYVWATKEDHFVKINLDSVLDSILDSAYEDFDADSLNGLDDLEAAMKDFNAANFEHISYIPDYTKAIIVSAP